MMLERRIVRTSFRKFVAQGARTPCGRYAPRDSLVIHIKHDHKPVFLRPRAIVRIQQRAAAKRLRSIADNLPPVYRGFYDHIMEERRRKKADKELR
jgi:hypothetical protein